MRVLIVSSRVLFPFSMLADKLNMSTDDAEKWIVNLIRNARLDAKIDAKEVCMYGTLVMVQYQGFIQRGGGAPWDFPPSPSLIKMEVP